MKSTALGICASLAVCGTAALAASIGTLIERHTADPQPDPQIHPQPQHTPLQPAPAEPPQPLSPVVEKALHWLIAAQSEDGGYGQDGRQPRAEVALESNDHDAANTAMAALAMLRSGSTPSAGPFAQQLRLAVDYVLRAVEAAPAEGLALVAQQGTQTQIQRKLGPNVDTFLSAMLLGELRGRMPDEASEQRVFRALDKVVGKIERNQQQDGSWNSGGGWAPIISTSIASRSLDLAEAKGRDVDARVQARVDDYTKRQFDPRKNEIAVGEGDAGVQLYKVAQVMEQASRAPAAAGNREALAVAGDLLDSERFAAGFGSMGGEEFISYMNISDSLLRTDAKGEKWQSWNRSITERLAAMQNQDGSWAGHHCITGRVACTAAAILTLTAERTVM
jgi:hypothetical protein